MSPLTSHDLYWVHHSLTRPLRCYQAAEASQTEIVSVKVVVHVVCSPPFQEVASPLAAAVWVLLVVL